MIEPLIFLYERDGMKWYRLASESPPAPSAAQHFRPSRSDLLPSRRYQSAVEQLNGKCGAKYAPTKGKP